MNSTLHVLNAEAFTVMHSSFYNLYSHHAALLSEQKHPTNDASLQTGNCVCSQGLITGLSMHAEPTRHLIPVSIFNLSGTMRQRKDIFLCNNNLVW